MLSRVCLVLCLAAFATPAPAMARVLGFVAAQGAAPEKTPPPSASTVAEQRDALHRELEIPPDAQLSKSLRSKFAARLIEIGKEAPIGSDRQYAALHEGYTLAVAASDIEAVLHAVDLLEAVFEVEARTLRVQALVSIGRTAAGKQTRVVGERSLEVAHRCVEDEDFENALALLDDPKIRKYTRDDPELAPIYEKLRGGDVQAYARLREFIVQLETAPDDPQANHFAGYHYCFDRGDFERGLAHLSKGHLPAYREIAAADVAARDAEQPADAAGMLRLGVRWAEFAANEINTPKRKTHTRARARHWLTAARAKANALDGEQRAELEAALADLDRADAAAAEERARRVAPTASGASAAAKPSRVLAGLPKESRECISTALLWLAAHQSSDGKWDCDGFPELCALEGGDEASACEGRGEALHDVGVSGLALLAFLRAGHDAHSPDFGAHVSRGLDWLVAQQNPTTGLIGERIGHGYNYGHAIATAALAQALSRGEDERLRGACERAVGYIHLARNPGPGWRYNEPAQGLNSDTSVTGWMLHALVEARAAGVEIDAADLTGGLRWIDSVTHAETGRVGYDSAIGPSARVSGVNDHFNSERGECMTAVALTCRLALGQTVASTPVIRLHVQRLVDEAPTWNADPKQLLGVDFYYWRYGAEAMRRSGDERARAWFAALRAALAPNQVSKGHGAGSWDPEVDPWGYSGGRIYTTAMGALSLLAEDSGPLAQVDLRKLEGMASK